ncbi:CDP-diacylglycerol--serine O-phosphatidyltransferase [Marinicrinis lubricantis]|uniref:CDP-diacylglycerol--serine O-phosphatidyltransferase n=1 Tax=Marinicrinis lubricantis TaxID=2086470 RepID=A0ABW1IS10_9BACL
MFTKSLPSFFTICNLFLGIISIILVFHEKPDYAAIMVIVAMLTDGLDGRVARALNVQSEFGKELDSLSDVISFGVAPAFIMYVVAFQEMNEPLAWMITALFPICGALRLARFNVVEAVPGYFIGLPIPAAGGVLATLALFHNELSTVVLAIVTVMLALLMISTVKYPSFKKVGIPKAAIWITPIIVVVAVVLAVLFPGQISKIIMIPLVFYAIWGLKKNVRIVRFLARRRKKKSVDEESYQESR